ncbi:MAG: homoserine dehydrogenase [Tistlia sp.]|uniref:homoserine dehydrogenase n=1 Tax=Tistlia sp. TaxID=3057121 RepID=UPI0034A32BE7
MNLEALLGRSDGRVFRVGLVGVGEFGRSFLSQARLVPDLSARVACDRDVERAAAAFRDVGLAAEEIRICDSPAAAGTALEAGQAVVVADAELLVGLPLDVVVEATGEPGHAAAIAEAAIAAGKHVVMVTKEAESVVGPLLAHKARQAGVVHTPVDGDQPSLLIGLVAWSRLLGLEIVAAGKASEYDFVYDPAAGSVTAQGRTVALPGFGAHWSCAPSELREAVAARAGLLAGFAHRTVPDLCEMTIVCNATGLGVDRPALHAPIARTLELPDLFGAEAGGGLLSREGVVDIFNCLRRPDELSFAGGVFVVARTPDPVTGRLFKDKGIPVSGDDGRVLIHNPVHLLGAEAPMSVLSACRAGRSTAGEDVRPRVDLTAVADRAIAAGTRFEIGHRHEIGGLRPAMLPAAPLGAATPLPYYLLAGAVARVEIAEGAAVTAGMVEIPEDSVLHRLRREQDALFFGG